MSNERLVCFKAYDVRGKVPEELNEEMAYKIGRAYVSEIQPQGAVAVGRDIRESSPGISEAVIRGINDAGTDTVDIGLCGTEMVYFAASLEGIGGGIMWNLLLGSGSATGAVFMERSLDIFPTINYIIELILK